MQHSLQEGSRGKFSGSLCNPSTSKRNTPALSNPFVYIRQDIPSHHEHTQAIFLFAFENRETCLFLLYLSLGEIKVPLPIWTVYLKIYVTTTTAARHGLSKKTGRWANMEGNIILVSFFFFFFLPSSFLFPRSKEWMKMYCK